MGHSLGRGEEGRRPGRRISERSHGWIQSDLVLVTWNRPCDARAGSEERVGGQWRLRGPHFCSSFILLSALPARNHSIWVSLKVWFRRMVSWVPLGCLMMHVSGCEEGHVWADGPWEHGPGFARGSGGRATAPGPGPAR